jgi:recombination protein RecR
VLPARLTRLIDLFARLPGVGEKTAQRFVLWLVSEKAEVARELGQALSELEERVRPCSRCKNVAEVDEHGQALCSVCRDHRRDSHLLCFVLGRLLSPLDGIGPEELPLPELMQRIVGDGVTEVILATPPSVDGEATALLLARELAGRGLKLTRIASGVPHGGDLEFADQITLGRALDGRREV